MKLRTRTCTDWYDAGWVDKGTGRKIPVEVEKPKDDALGWVYCWSYTMDYCCRHRLTKPHWHMVSRGRNGETIIDWFSVWLEPNVESYRCFCYHCKKDITNGDHMAPHWIPALSGRFFCDDCMKEHYPVQWKEAHEKGHGCYGYTGKTFKEQEDEKVSI
jgi:hypothetical protein